MPRDRIPPLILATKATNQPTDPTMTNARPSARQLNDFRQALQQAAQASAQVRPINQLAAQRDAYLASLR